MRRTVALFLALLLTLAWAGQVQAKDIVLGVPLPLTGAQAKFGEIIKKSYEIAQEEINAKGGVKGDKLVLNFEDSQGKPEISRSIVEKLIDVDKQPVVFAEYTSACAKAVAAVAEERKTPYLVVASAADEITQQNYKYVFRLNPSNAYYASAC
jgi:ABC-type branched-chain amino acid transport systems, periplasmic component